MSNGPCMVHPTFGLPLPGPASQAAQIEHLNKVVKLLWKEVEQLRQFISVGPNETVVKCGDASIRLKKDGTIEIKGKDITVAGSGRVNVKSAGDLLFKGSKVQGN
jgi:hypothetical protein